MKQFTKEEFKEIFKDAINSSAKAKILRRNKELKEFCQYQIENSNRSIF